MKPSNIVIVSLFCVLATGSEHAQTTTDVEGIHVATQSFIAAIAARDIDAMDRAWTHESYSSFIGPLSKTCGWLGGHSQGVAVAVWPVRPGRNLR
jgi:hypothetical protein